MRILCFGDSLTAGYSQFGTIYHPYKDRLEQLIAMAYPSLQVETVVDGMPGETVVGGFERRMQKHFPDNNLRINGDAAADNATAPYDWAIILGGTNDIGYNIPAETAFEKLKAVWEMPLSRKVKVLALTVPEGGGVRGRAWLSAQRDKLNGLIKGYKRENFYVFDLHAAVPNFSMSAKDQERYWDDGLHLTPDGYDLMGTKIGISLVSIFAKDKAFNDAVNPPRRRKFYFKDDELFFEEESGDPHALDQGYVVVRRKDLD